MPTSQSEQLRSNIDASVPVTNRPKPLLVDNVLSFIAAYRLKGDTDSLKKIVVERFSNDVEAAKRLLWDYCSSDLLAKGLVFHARRDSDRRSPLEAHLNDLLGAFSALDASDSIPTICCEAISLFRIPPISLDPVAEQVHSNSQALRALSLSLKDWKRNSLTFLCLVHTLQMLLVLSKSVMLELLPPLLLRFKNLLCGSSQEFCLS